MQAKTWVTWAGTCRGECGALGAETKLSAARSLPCCCLLRRGASPAPRGDQARRILKFGGAPQARQRQHSLPQARSAPQNPVLKDSPLRLGSEQLCVGKLLLVHRGVSSGTIFLVVRKCTGGGISQIADTHLLWIVAGMGLARKEVRGS